MQMARRSFSPFFSFARMSFLFHPGLDMCANSALALKGGGGGGGVLVLPLVTAGVTRAHIQLSFHRRMTLHPAEQHKYHKSESLGEQVL